MESPCSLGSVANELILDIQVVLFTLTLSQGAFTTKSMQARQTFGTGRAAGRSSCCTSAWPSTWAALSFFKAFEDAARIMCERMVALEAIRSEEMRSNAKPNKIKNEKRMQNRKTLRKHALQHAARSDKRKNALLVCDINALVFESA